MAIYTHLYAIYPGSVTLYDGTEVEFTALELAEAYGVQDEPYITISSPEEVPQGMDFFDYIHLKPRPDNYYENWKDYALDNGEEVAMGEDFDGDRQYTQETDKKALDIDTEMH